MRSQECPLVKESRRALREAIESEGKKSMKRKKKGIKSKTRKIRQEINAGKKEDKVEKVMHEFKEGTLHSGSKKGPKVHSRKQAVAIALSEARKKKRRRHK